MSLVNTLVEGVLDLAVATKVIDACGHTHYIAFPSHGSGFVLKSLHRYNLAAKVVPCLAMVDLRDTGCDCAPDVLTKWLPNRNDDMLFRVVVNEIESWLMADRLAFSQFVHLAVEHVPSYPELEPFPKRTVVNLARRSGNRAVRNTLVPREGMGASEGPLYTSEMMRFARESWEPERACENSPSLAQCIRRLRELP